MQQWQIPIHTCTSIAVDTVVAASSKIDTTLLVAVDCSPDRALYFACTSTPELDDSSYSNTACDFKPSANNKIPINSSILGEGIWASFSVQDLSLTKNESSLGITHIQYPLIGQESD